MHGYQQHASASNSNANSMQLMPYTAQSKTLNPDELSKLYNMNPYNRTMSSGTGGMVNFPNIQSGINLGHLQNHATNIASQMSLAQANTNPAQYLTSPPYLQQQGMLNGKILYFNLLQTQKDKVHLMLRIYTAKVHFSVDELILYML